MECADYIFLHSGHPLPGTGVKAERNEGFDLALDKVAAETWRNAGKVWEAVSSRIVIARQLALNLLLLMYGWLNNVAMLVECISLCAWHFLFVYFVKQCIHALNHPYIS